MQNRKDSLEITLLKRPGELDTQNEIKLQPWPEHKPWMPEHCPSPPESSGSGSVGVNINDKFCSQLVSCIVLAISSVGGSLTRATSDQNYAGHQKGGDHGGEKYNDKNVG